MDLSNLKPNEGSTKDRKRLGRGQGSGYGGHTTGKGHKGQQARSGWRTKKGFEGGQMPLQRRVPKFGFRNINRKEFKGVNVNLLQALADSKKLEKIDLEVLIANGVVQKKDLVKILGKGELKAKLEITAHAFSETAKKLIEAAGGTATIITK
ncbi:MAG: 50S ribosomal protein L15 [Flavobacteriales bacterium]|nr:50S ribosomal protein L15 [Flavobacteriales bacterium]